MTDNEQRPVVNDQEPTGEQGISSDKPGVDPGGYPDKPRLDESDTTANTDMDDEEDSE